MFPRICFLLVLGLDPVVGLVFENPQSSSGDDFSMQLQSDERVEKPLERFFLNCFAQEFGPRERVRVIFLCQCVNLFTLCFVPSVGRWNMAVLCCYEKAFRCSEFFNSKS